MAVRIRKDRKTIVCAANAPAQEGDCYLDDHVHYVLGTEMGVLRYMGQDLWEFGERQDNPLAWIDELPDTPANKERPPGMTG